MQNPVQRLLIIIKANSASLHAEAEAIADMAMCLGISSKIKKDRLEEFVFDSKGFKPDMVLILGGDGTVLSVVRKLPDKTTPLLGINFGQIGFLTEIQPESWRKELPEIFSGQYTLRPGPIFNFSVTRNGQIVKEGEFINDLVISRGTLARLINLHIWYGEQDLGKVRADAVIAATPSGASSYCISAGGPLVHPDLPCIILCPVSPFLHNFYPIVLPPDKTLRIRVKEKQTTTCMTQDGQVSFILQPDDEIYIRKAQHALALVKPIHFSYFDKLRSKGFLGSIHSG